MTMPHLMNCPHSEDWCLACVKEMHAELEAAEAKAAAFDRVLAAWGMTWEEYKQQSGTDAPDTVREPNAETQAIQDRDRAEQPA